MRKIILLLLSAVLLSSCSGIKKLAQLQIIDAKTTNMSMISLTKMDLGADIEYHNPNADLTIHSVDMDVFIQEMKVAVVAVADPVVFESGEGVAELSLRLNFSMSAILTIVPELMQSQDIPEEALASGEIEYSVDGGRIRSLKFNNIELSKLQKLNYF